MANPAPGCFAVRAAWTFVALHAPLYALFIVPYGRELREAFTDVAFPVVDVLAEWILWFDVVRPARFTGSGDTSFAWAYCLLSAVVSLLVAAVWALRGHPASPRSRAWLRTLLRYALGANLIAYGLAKLTGEQFPFPDRAALGRAYGDSSPMTLLWTFMGASPGLCAFAGVIEIAGGALVLFRRTTCLGALIVAAALTHVVVLNFTYDVPVKLFSLMMTGTAIALVWPDRRRLGACFLGTGPVGPPAPEPPVGPPRWRPWLKAAAIVVLLSPAVVHQARHVYGRLGDDAAGRHEPPPRLLTERFHWIAEQPYRD